MNQISSVRSIVANLDRDSLIDLLDEVVGVGIRDEDSDESLQEEVTALYEKGLISAQMLQGLA